MSTKRKSGNAAKAGTNPVSEIIIDSEGRILVRNLSGDVLDAIRGSTGGDDAMEARYRKLCKFRKTGK